MRTIWASILWLAACPAQALVYEQANTGYSNIVSQDFTDARDFSTFSSDDVLGLGPIRILAARAFGTETGLPSQNVAVWFGIGRSADRGSIEAVAAGSQQGEDLIFEDISLIAIVDFHVFFWVERPFDPGRVWFWNQTTTLVNQETHLHNPGNAYGHGGDPFPIKRFLGISLDSSFRIEYEIVPEPASMIALGAGVAAIAARRRTQLPAPRTPKG